MGYVIILSAATAAIVVVTAVILLIQAGINAERLLNIQEQLKYSQDDIDTLIKHLGADRGVAFDGQLGYEGEGDHE